MIIGIGIIVLAIGFLVFQGMDKSMMAYVEVSDIGQAQQVNSSGILQIVGIVQPGSVEIQTVSRKLKFLLQDLNNPEVTIPVTYTGIVPDNFKPGQQVIVQGALTEDQRIVQAQQLLVKCPSKYETTME